MEILTELCMKKQYMSENLVFSIAERFTQE